MFILNKKACHSEYYLLLYMAVYLLFNYTHSGISLCCRDVFTGVVQNDCRSSLSGALNTIIIITEYDVVTACFIVIAVSLCCLFFIKDITKLRGHYRTVILNHSETRLHITAKR